MMNGTFTNTGRYYDDRWLEQHTGNEKSTITKMQHHYWVTKKTVFRKFGKKEDECIVASDAELDAKLELFHSIQDSCLVLQRIIDKYQERLCNLAQEENSMGRFLKEAGKNDKTRAGKMMTAVGKSLSYSGQQRLTLRMPLIRLYQEVETFRHRAIEDTLQNVHSMEKVRTEYRASLSWMKNVSLQLDPDTHKQLERFRKVQGQVRRSKVQFDQLKLDCLQKVDLLAAARCNMFSHALILYQSSLLQFAEKTTKTFTTIANSFKGYQHYEFCVVKELTESSLKLAEQTNGNLEISREQEKYEETDEDKDKLLFFESEYRDDAGTGETSNVNETQLASLGDLLTESSPDMLLDFGFDSVELTKTHNDPQSTSTNLELLTSSVEECKLFDEILSTEDEGGLGEQWDAMFGVEAKEEENSFLPCQLFDQYAAARRCPADATGEASAETLLTPSPTHIVENKCALASGASTTAKHKGQDKKTWYNLFADLDPLADPDAVGVTAGHDDRNC